MKQKHHPAADPSARATLHKISTPSPSSAAPPARLDLTAITATPAARLNLAIPPQPATTGSAPPTAPAAKRPAKPTPADEASLADFTIGLSFLQRLQLADLNKQLASCGYAAAASAKSARQTFAEKAETCRQLRELLGDHYRAHMRKVFSYRKSHAARWAQAGEVLRVASPRGDDQGLTSEAHVRPLTALNQVDLLAVFDRLRLWKQWAPTAEVTPAWCAAAVQFQKPDPKPNTDLSDKAQLVLKVLEHFESVRTALPANPPKELAASVENFTAEVMILGEQSRTGIAWTQATWNPLHGCAYASEGCQNCYAARLMATRFRDRYPGLAEERIIDGEKRYFFTGKLLLDPHALAQVLVDRHPKRFFVNSMSDLFHPQVPDAYLDAMFDTMERAWWHQYQVLTKRPERMADYTQKRYANRPPPPHIWLGTSTEDQAAFDQCIEHLARTKTAVRWLSCEPLLGPVDLGLQKRFEWVVIGGESGSTRQMQKEWATSLRDQCAEFGVPFFFKQWGDYNEAGEKVRRKPDASGALPTLGGKKHGAYPMRLDLGVLQEAAATEDREAIFALLRRCLLSSIRRTSPRRCTPLMQHLEIPP